MSYTNGVGTPQQFPVTSEAVASLSTSRATRTESGPLSVSNQNGPANAAPVDQATLSSTASLVTKALSGSDVRSDKVTALQQSIASGTYNVSPSDVATKVMSALLH